MTKLYPEFKNAAKIVVEGEETFFSDGELEVMLDAEFGTKTFSFRLLALVKELLENHGIDFIRAHDKDLGEGYKIATDKESLDVTVPRLSKRVSNATRKQALVLNKINRENLVSHDKEKYDHGVVRNGLFTSLIAQTNRSKLVAGASVKVDMPRLISE